MPSACVNEGGPPSLVRLGEVPLFEVESSLGPEAVRALRAWQARPGAVVTLLAPDGMFYRGRLTRLEEEGGAVVPFASLGAGAESPTRLEVYQALPEKERFELILEKLTELGVWRIAPCTTSRSATREERDAGQKKSHRWPEVVRRAALQCRRGMLPELFPVLSWEETLYEARHADLKLLLAERDAPWSLKEALGSQTPLRVALLVGPEGGFSPEEFDEARGAGFLPVSLGGRILRTETAAIVAAALLQYALGDLG